MIPGAQSAKRILLMSGGYGSPGVAREEVTREGAVGFMENLFNASELFELLDHWAEDKR